MDKTQRISTQSAEILELIAGGNSYEQIVHRHPDLTYLDIFEAAKEALDALGNTSANFSERMDQIKSEHPMAYQPWTKEDEEMLRQLHESGVPVQEMATHLERQPSAIRSRLTRLGLKD